MFELVNGAKKLQINARITVIYLMKYWATEQWLPDFVTRTAGQ